MLRSRIPVHIGRIVIEDEVIPFVDFSYQGCKSHITIRLMVTVDLTICGCMEKRSIVTILDIKKS